MNRNHVARKRFGQNFLHDPAVIDNIITAINPEKHQALVEIGPGLGALTKPTLEKIDQLTVIEIDWDLAHQLSINPLWKNRLTIIEKDAMTVDFSQLSDIAQKPLRIFGNLPYNISTALIFHLFTFIAVITDMHFMLQREVVARLTAVPNSKTYGRLSVMAQYFCQIIPLLSVPPTAFHPLPKVYSNFVRLIPYRSPPYTVKNIASLSLITQHAFNQRRKTINNSLSSLFNATHFEQLNIDKTMRAENLSVEQYVKLANQYYSENRDKWDN